MNITELGFTKEEVLEKVVDRIVSDMLEHHFQNYDGDISVTQTKFSDQIKKLVVNRIDDTVKLMADREILPKVADLVESLTLQETNKWGEKIGKPVTFIEYLVQRAEHYIMEEVDYNGKAKRDGDSYNWKASGTRISHLIHSHLDHHIRLAMQEAMKVAVGSVAKGIHETARIKLNEIAEEMSKVKN